MKKLFTLIALSSLSYNVYAQSLTSQNVLPTIYGLPNDPIMQAAFDIYNSNANTLDVKVERTNISVLPNSINYFCWGPQCYGPGQNISAVPASIPPNTLETSFYADYTPNGDIGVTTVDYRFFDMNNPSDEVTVRIDYDTQTLGINNPNANTNYLDIIYKQSSNLIALSYGLKSQQAAEIKMIDILGNTLRKFTVNSTKGNLIISTVDIPSGVYFVTLNTGSKAIANKKLVVNHR